LTFSDATEVLTTTATTYTPTVTPSPGTLYFLSYVVIFSVHSCTLNYMFH